MFGVPNSLPGHLPGRRPLVVVVVTLLMSCSAYVPRLVVYQKSRDSVFVDIVYSSLRLDLLVPRFD